MRPLTVKVPRSLERRLDELARRRAVPRSVIVREALEAYVARAQTSPLDLIADLVGSVDGLPSDLSTNPKYMEGFGEYRPPRRRPRRRAS